MSQPETNPLAAVSSPDLNAERLAALKKLFPDLFSNEGRLNVDELKKVVDPALVSETERYDFRWYGNAEAQNIELLKQYIRDKEATFHLQFEKDKVLDEVLLKNGFMLDYALTRRPEFTKNEVSLAKDAHKESLVCLDAKLEAETVDHFKTHKDQFFICLELALDTTKKWNLKHHLGEKLKAI